MNIGLITARLIQDPIRFSNFSDYFTEIEINFLHAKNDFAYAIALAKGKIGDNIFEFYCKGDYILVEGEYIVNEDNSLVVFVRDVQPAHLIIK